MFIHPYWSPNFTLTLADSVGPLVATDTTAPLSITPKSTKAPEAADVTIFNGATVTLASIVDACPTSKAEAAVAVLCIVDTKAPSASIAAPAVESTSKASPLVAFVFSTLSPVPEALVLVSVKVGTASSSNILRLSSAAMLIMSVIFSPPMGRLQYRGKFPSLLLCTANYLLTDSLESSPAHRDDIYARKEYLLMNLQQLCILTFY